MRSLVFSLIAFYTLTIPSLASEVLIRTDTGVGQGFLLENDNKCYAITPRHVVETASKIELQTRFPRIYTFSQEHLFDVDLAVLSTQEKVALCESLDFTFADKLAAFLQIIDEGILKTQLDDGSVKQTKVDIVTVDNTEFLEIRPKDGEDTLQQGNSGSVLYVANNPAGILLEVSGLTGVIYRSDALKPKLAAYFADPSSAPQKEEGPQYISSVFSKRIAQDEVVEFKFAGEANSPLEFHLPKVAGDFNYYFNIFDDRDNNVWSRGNAIYSGNEYRFTFTPQKTQTYTLRLRGSYKYGELRGRLQQWALNSQLRGQANIIAVGDEFSTRIANNATAEFKFSGQANSPLEFHLPKVAGDFNYYFNIFDGRDNNVWSHGNALYAGNEYRFTFTPQKTQTYTLRLRGSYKYGELRGRLQQWALNSQLRGQANIIAVGDEFSTRIANNATAEFRFSGQANSPLEFQILNVGDSFGYYFDIFDGRDNNVWSHGNALYAGNEYRFTFTPQKTQTYTLRLRGSSKYGELRGKLWPGE